MQVQKKPSYILNFKYLYQYQKVLKHDNMNFNNLYFPREQLINENNRVRTPETHFLFELTKRTIGLCENKKSGKLS